MPEPLPPFSVILALDMPADPDITLRRIQHHRRWAWRHVHPDTRVSHDNAFPVFAHLVAAYDFLVDQETMEVNRDNLRRACEAHVEPRQRPFNSRPAPGQPVFLPGYGAQPVSEPEPTVAPALSAAGTRADPILLWGDDEDAPSVVSSDDAPDDQPWVVIGWPEDRMDVPMSKRPVVAARTWPTQLRVRNVNCHRQLLGPENRWRHGPSIAFGAVCFAAEFAGVRNMSHVSDIVRRRVVEFRNSRGQGGRPSRQPAGFPFGMASPAGAPAWPGPSRALPSAEDSRGPRRSAGSMRPPRRSTPASSTPRRPRRTSSSTTPSSRISTIQTPEGPRVLVDLTERTGSDSDEDVIITSVRKRARRDDGQDDGAGEI